MKNIVIYDEIPDVVLYMPLPDGKADVWLRKNIREFIFRNADLGESETITRWAADEAYMRCKLALAEIQADIDAAFERASRFKQGDDEEKKPSRDERISQLERENAELFQQVTDTQLALCELYESLI